MHAPILRMRFPALANAPLVESRVCQYENSTDHNFILDRHPERKMSGSWAAAPATALSTVR